MISASEGAATQSTGAESLKAITSFKAGYVNRLSRPRTLAGVELRVVVTARVSRKRQMLRIIIPRAVLCVAYESVAVGAERTG
jgi:hypothetical protein